MISFEHARNLVEYQAGETPFLVGEPGDLMYGVVEGQVDLVLDEQVLDTIGPGGILGEMSLVDAAPRSASAVARTAARCALITKDEFTFLVQEHPTFAFDVMRVLATRIRDANHHHA